MSRLFIAWPVPGQGPAASLIGGRRTPHPLAKPAAGATDPRLQSADETSQRHRGHAERVGAGARIAPGALSRLGQSETAKLLHWRRVQCEAVAAAGGLENPAGGGDALGASGGARQPLNSRLGADAPNFVPSSARADPGCRPQIILRIRQEGLTYILHDGYSDGASPNTFCRPKVLLKNPLPLSRIDTQNRPLYAP